MVDKHRITGGIINAGTIQGVDRKTNFLRAHGQLGLEHNIFLVLRADICVDLTIPGLVRALNGIGGCTGQIVNVIDIGCAVGFGADVGSIHLDRRAVVEIDDLGTQGIPGQVAIGIVRFADYHSILFHIQVLTGSDAIGQNIHQADFQFPGTLH